MPTSRRNLPPLQVGTAYLAADFQYFELALAMLTGSKAILRLHLKNKTIVDLPTDDAELGHLLIMLCEAFPVRAIDHLEKRGWVTKKA